MSKKYLSIIVETLGHKRRNGVEYERTRQTDVDFQHRLTSSILRAVGAEANSEI